MDAHVPDTLRQEEQDPNVTLVTATAPISVPTHGGRAKCLQRLVRLGLPVPRTVALGFGTVHRIAQGDLPDIHAILSRFPDSALLCVRHSSEDMDWGGPGSVLNIGMNDATYARLRDKIGKDAASALYQRFVMSFAIHVARLDPDAFEEIESVGQEGLAQALKAYEEQAEEPFPQCAERQLAEVLRSMARAWEGTTARLLRQAKGAPVDAGLGLIVQEMALGLGIGECGSGVLQLVDSDTGLPQVTGRYLSQSQGREALQGGQAALYLARDPRGPSLEDLEPAAFEELKQYAAYMRNKLRAEMQIEFTIENGQVHVLDGVRVKRSSRAALRIAVRLAEDEIITRQEAVMRVEPHSLTELLHRQVDPDAQRDAIGRGVAASPGAATGRIVFSSNEAQASAARGEPCVLVRRETSPEDVRGMHAAVAVLTERGGMTSHAAVIGRGIGLPCVVGAVRMGFRHDDKLLLAEDGRRFHEGDIITVDGSAGQVLAGAPKMIEAALDDVFHVFMSWADAERDIGVRANADTPQDAATARNFMAQGIGLCRTEHMFFEDDRITPMREMIFADSPKDREAALARLLPMQRKDFTELFRIMEGMPVCIRLFDPPLHEFLPNDRAGLRALAEAVDRPISEVTRRVASMGEYNPMLGMRGVRLGITVPEIYDMQARAIFEATLDASRIGAAVVPEIMLPLVSACREVEIVRTRIDAVAAAVRNERGRDFDYSLGVMVETPRACLRADEIAQHAHFLSFGTNDLTQMTYGLSRDDAGRFMSHYVQQGVFPEDPFHRLDAEGVGELIRIGVERGRRANGGVMLSVCGEHGGNPESIAFCRSAGIDYVSCSPFRVPVARLAAAQLAIRDKIA
ncbi:pyruvate phosphate dikinase [Salipiger aestuarii]|uniref:Pyruvate, phosphate dikinase n=1 Tax=Salipiger aestuarii TaxID=568098 RepID=A0A327Y615_9RHOB|nr:putative PEP-binding protein [Salipiger aestuarii]EIE52047.1 pyruvate phosphate dikinase [Citreicella sp. 357]KAA8608110.1 pyruvate phosphate dikinase [Salipiger aestuarii]KAA8611356.1 pyruvate phosphate dikinase [Salipiger aestuarii]KAB2542068.1 pyruvate phosphate dikinase [Salipiger aestuarii]RAK16493.1 pyruvate,orthophosphate dikinase [Salipiger aestuarii]